MQSFMSVSALIWFHAKESADAAMKKKSPPCSVFLGAVPDLAEEEINSRNTSSLSHHLRPIAMCLSFCNLTFSFQTRIAVLWLKCRFES